MKLSQLKILICVFFSIDTFALPVAENVISGNGRFDRNSTELNVHQNSDFLHIQYESFDISATESVNFSQPSSMSIVINEVLNADPTQIAGQLSANGQLFLLAPGGLVIHDGATIEATSFFASTLGVESVSAQQIQLLAGNSQSSLKNNGTISVQGGGYLELLSNTIINNGTIENQAGGVALTVAGNALVRFSNDFFALEVEQAALNGLIDNTGTISAVAGNVELKTLVRDQINELVINNQGNISATSVWQEGGDIYIGSNQGDIENHGLIESISTVNTSAQSHIQINSDRIANFGSIKNNAAGNGNAGSIELNAESMVVLLDESLIQANADQNGDGGNVKVFSPDSAIFRQGARIEAEAGFNLGDGGFVDVSGWEYIEINGRVSTIALNGKNGEFLIDPYNVTISAGATINDPFTIDTYTPSGSGATINVTELQNNLKSGNVTVVTSGAGAESGDISVSVGIDLDGTNGNTLSLIADGSIVLNGSIVDGTLGTADATNITLQALGGTITSGINTVKSGGGAIELKTSGNVTLGTGGNLDLSSYDTEGGSLTVESTAGSVSLLSDLELDGRSGSTLSLNAATDLNIDFDIIDSVTASADSVAISLIAGNNVNMASGKSINTYGSLATINAGNDVAITNFTTLGGDLNISANNITDAGDAGSGYDINTGGGVATFNLSGNFGGTSTVTAIEVNDSVIDLTAIGSNQNFYISAAGTQDLTIRDFEYDGTSTFNFNGAHTGTGSFIFSGGFSDLDSSGDVATLTVNTSGVGSHIQVNSSADIRSGGGNILFTSNDANSDIIIGGSAMVRSQGGSITYDAGGDIGLTYTRSDGGAINLTAQNIYDNGSTRSDLVADAGVVTINASGNVGGTSSASALEVEGGIYNYTAAGINQNLFLSALGTNDLTLNNVDYNGTGTFNLGISYNGTGDIIVAGDIRDSNIGTTDIATINFATVNASSDIRILDGASIRSGDSGGITLNSANDIYLTGIFGGSGGTSVTAANDIINNGNTTLDIQSTGDVLLDAGRHVANGDSINVMANTLNLNLGTGNQNIITEGTTALGNIEVDGANGAALSVIGLTELNVTGSIVDSVGSDDLIDLTLGTSSGFITLPNGGYTVPGSLTFLSGTEGIQDSIDERVSITANSLTSSGNNFLSNTGPVIFDLTVNDLDIRDDSGTVIFEINNSKSMRIIDLNGDGEFLLGKQFKLNINGDLEVPNATIDDVDDQLWIVANDIDDPDADNIITIRDSADTGNDFNLIVELTAANNVQINTEISNFDGTVAAGGTLTIDNEFGALGLDLSTDLNLDGSLINGDGDIVIETLGMMNLSNSGLTTTGNLFLTADDIMDSDTQINLSAANVLLQLNAPTASLYTLNLTADSLDASLAGSNTGLIVQASQDLQIQDLNSDGSSLNISDGYAWIDVAGAVSLDDTISINDSNVDGIENGWMYIGYQGNAAFGVNSPLQMTIDGSLESGTPSALNITGSQLLVRQTGAANNANTLQFTDADIRVIGGDAVFDIANKNTDPTGFGIIAMSANSGITASNTAAESIFTQLDYTSLQLDGSLNVGSERDIKFLGYSSVENEITEVPAEVVEEINQAVADIINETMTDSAQAVSDDIQSETVAAVESSPNVNVALNEMFSDCKKSDTEDSRCKVKDEISRFLGRFLMGGSMPKTN
jgi:filamentous hemagglutinin family protein